MRGAEAHPDTLKRSRSFPDVGLNPTVLVDGGKSKVKETVSAPQDWGVSSQCQRGPTQLRGVYFRVRARQKFL